MIDENKTKKISLAVSIIGILALLIISANIKPPPYDLKDIDNTLLNKQVTVSGTIFNVRNYDDFQVISIKDDTGRIDITADSNLDLEYDTTILVSGEVREYNEYLQIRADSIKIIQEDA